MLIAVVGSRAFPNREAVEHFVGRLAKDATVVSGGAKGVDSWAVEAAHAAGLEVIVMEADWERHGRSAGPIRNHEIVRLSDMIVAFWDGKSRGTLNTVALAVGANVPVQVHGASGESLDLNEVMDVAIARGVVASIERALSKEAQHKK